MSGSNQFLPIATGGGANTLTPAAYAALTTLLANGYQSGTASSTQINTTLRQSSFVAAAVAQLIADVTGFAVLDNGVIANFESQLAVAMGLLGYGLDTGTANAYIVTFSPAELGIYDGLRIRWRALNANTGASTLNINGLGSKPIWSAQHAVLTGNEIVVGGEVEVVWNASLNSGAGAWVLLECTGGAQQLPAGSYCVTPAPGDNSTKVATTAFMQSLTNLNGGAFAGLRNRIINGDGRFNLRGATACPVATYTYAGDRVVINPTGAAVTGNVAALSANASGLAYGHSVGGVASLSAVQFGQRVEAYNCFDLASAPVTFSFWAYQTSGSAATVSASLNRAPTTDTWSGGAGTLESNLTLNATALPTGTWTKFYGTATLSALATTGLMAIATIAGSLTSGVVQITGMQLERGPVATVFEQRPVQLDLALAMRYYQQIQLWSVGYAVAGSGPGSVSIFPVPMRATPTLTTVSASNSNVGSVTLSQNYNCIIYYANLVTATGQYNLSTIQAANAEL